MSYTFKGGLHINDHKELTNACAIKKLNGCDVHIFPLQQHIGAVTKPVVKPGDRVLAGQKIADSDVFMSVPVHSSVSGTVREIKSYIHPNGAKVNAVFIENDFKYESCESIKHVSDIDKMSKEEMLDVIREKGIVGMGGAGFPTFIKLNPRTKVDYVIVNGAECEPYITSDHRRMLENTDEIIDGLGIAMKILGLKKGYIGIEMNKQDAAEVISKRLEGRSDIEVKMLKTKYPQGAEKQLIKAITKRSVPTGRLPADAGVVVLNIDTVYSVSRAFRLGMPPRRRVVTVTGDCVKSPGNYEVPLGVPFSYLFDAAGGFTSEPKKIIMGGPMMGLSQYSMDAPVIKTTSALLAFSEIQEIYNETLPCIRCGKCVDYCPMHLMPLNLARFSASDNLEMAEKYHITDCMECGLCSYVCPASRNPVQFIRIGKQAVIQKKRNQGGK